jgi:hypothetical protein
MEIHIPSEQRLRVITNQKRIFIDASSAPHQECLTVEFYSFQKQQIRSKSGTFKMFVFQKDQDITDFDFGFWNDAEIVWQSF